VAPCCVDLEPLGLPIVLPVGSILPSHFTPTYSAVDRSSPSVAATDSHSPFLRSPRHRILVVACCSFGPAPSSNRVILLQRFRGPSAVVEVLRSQPHLVANQNLQLRRTSLLCLQHRGPASTTALSLPSFLPVPMSKVQSKTTSGVNFQRTHIPRRQHESTTELGDEKALLRCEMPKTRHLPRPQSCGSQFGSSLGSWCSSAL